MYFVERKKIRKTLIYIEQLLQTFDENELIEQYGQKLKLERTVHMLIESILDVGNMMIDGFVMRDPGSYEDIIDILADERVIPKEQVVYYKKLINLRRSVVVNYLTIDHAKLFDTLSEAKEFLVEFRSHVLVYLQEELDVPHAFTNEEK